ncbi:MULTISPECIES: nitroreductase family deazaflavin-dependent oxidoreductase [unclassified Solwaraspora]|uniref:nitroreductase family deazaflavin-dependent oxidoreductase n=1 Tax=unclassified Solwaraspora TaxID=2627926 RepID=UPI00248D3566|nr:MULTISPECIES: nitroreductase family deazaflavin-dependent oxidoreductase [unclassified Solwaraspora]WBB95333.1 nitroreductase family deazaflavin-dependent oxidoreductase [Solwaraspora sp. WMMA2059]WBC20761.1 nitroreductase family deazaflavin-dependent oxidoreductase [Solwaraspora sp. WMMA2080]WJK37106.1 nitroreductase family deazaflavin-dependent oxidoreductase [Solwaraspora sp. WMMA2065]
MNAAALPAGVERVSRIPYRLLSWGVPMGPLTLLRTQGRRTGLPRTVPVVTLRHADLDWLVSPFGVTQWVRNIRANGRAELGRGQRFRTVGLVEVDGETKLDVLHRYRRAFGFIPFVRQAFDATPGDGPSGFCTEADRHPVFLLQPPG